MKTACLLQLDFLDQLRAASDPDASLVEDHLPVAALPTGETDAGVADGPYATADPTVAIGAPTSIGQSGADVPAFGSAIVTHGGNPAQAASRGNPRTGAPGEVSAVCAAAHWGCSRDAVVAMIRLQHLDGGSRDHWYVVVDDWSMSLRDRVVALQTSELPLSNIAAFRRFDMIRVKSDCEDLPVTDNWIESYFALSDRYVGYDYPQEIRAMITAPDVEITRISRVLQTMDDDGRIYADRVAPYQGDLRSDLIEALNPDVPPLEYTWLHPAGKALPPIDEVAGARLLSMPPSRRRDRAIVHAASAAANSEMIQLSVQALSHARTARTFSDVDDNDEAAMEARWTAFLKGELPGDVGRCAIVRTFHDELACERTFCAYAEEPVSQQLKEWLWANMPPIPDGNDFWDLVRGTVDESVARGDARRKARTDVISDAYDDHAAEAEAALAEARVMYEHIATAHAAAGASPAWEFSFPLPMRDAGRREIGATMLVDMVSFRGDALIETLLADAKGRGEELTSKSFLRRHAPGGDRHDPARAQRRFAVYVGVEALDPNGPPALEPSMMATFKTGAALPPGMLPDSTVTARRAHLASRNLPIPSLRPKGLVGGSDPFERNLMVWGLRSGLVIYPAEAFVQACSIGNLFYRMSVANQARGGTAIQIVDDPSGFGTLPDEASRKRPFYWGIPKLGAGVAVAYPLDDGTPRAFKAHIGLTLEIEGTAGRSLEECKRLPVVEPSQDHPPSCGPARYGFQAAGRALIVGDVNYCLSHLFGRHVLTHDPRHSGANQRRQEGETKRQVANALGQKSEAVAGKYSRDTPRQVKALGGGRFISVRDAMAKLGVG